ncbi:MAG: hypothetical protein B6D62_01420 [Candidatus Cloacimonas sp. 4484_275]|nr:MAG: hypothetical protein B6D62_01420 [Candidatus Cloacimonas sp. 4484_275]
MFEIISNTVAAFLTLCIFSFLYKDNPFYKFAEALLVGVSMGYAIPLVFENVFIPYAYRPIFLSHNYIIIIPAFIGILYIFRFSKNLSWLSRYPIVFFMGIVGMGVPMSMHSSVLVGASFGYTVMARLSLLIGRIQFLLGDWLGLIK